MNLKKARRAIKKVAEQNGITEREAVREIEAAIAEAIENARRENDVSVLIKWQEIPSKGEIPTAYELVNYLGEKVKDTERGAIWLS